MIAMVNYYCCRCTRDDDGLAVVCLGASGFSKAVSWCSKYRVLGLTLLASFVSTMARPRAPFQVQRPAALTPLPDDN